MKDPAQILDLTIITRAHLREDDNSVLASRAILRIVHDTMPGEIRIR